MTLKNKKGLFITFEGIDGAGKTTQIEYTKNFLLSNGYQVALTQEPGALDLGKKIRNILLDDKNHISKKAELFLFLADRAQHVEFFIKQEIEKGKIVLCDRYIDSTIAYQGYGRENKNNLDELIFLNNIATDNLLPDLTLLFDIDPMISLDRINLSNMDRLEKEGVIFQKNVRNGYLSLAKNAPNRIKVINASQPIDKVFYDVKCHLKNIL